MTQQAQIQIPVFTPPEHCAWSVRRVRAFQTRRGVGASAELCLAGLHVADFHDDGNGGYPFLRWLHPHLPELEQLVATLAPQDLGTGHLIAYTPETFVEALVNHALTEHDLDRLLRRVVVVKAGKLLSYPARFKPTPENLLAALHQHPDGQLLNTMPRPLALAAYLNAA